MHDRTPANTTRSTYMRIQALPADPMAEQMMRSQTSRKSKAATQPSLGTSIMKTAPSAQPPAQSPSPETEDEFLGWVLPTRYLDDDNNDMFEGLELEETVLNHDPPAPASSSLPHRPDGLIITVPPTPAPVQPTRKRKQPRDEDTGLERKPRKTVKLTRRECAICADNVASNQFPKLPHIGARRHEHNTCLRCWDRHLRAEINNGKKFDHVSCPHCSQSLLEWEVRALAKKSTYREYLDKAAKSAMQADEEYRACPSATCSWACFMSKEDGNIFVCQVCSYRYCTHCETPMHEDETCAQYQTRLNAKATNDDLSRAEVEKVSKACPNSTCQARLDKWIGCDHVTCSQCRHGFCWECFAPYAGDEGIWSAGNDAHQAHCKYSPARLPNVPRDAIPDESDTEW